MGQFTTIKRYQQLLYLGPELPVGGTNNQLQFNNNGVFGGCQGTAWDDVNRALVISGATITATDPILDLGQTWNGSGVVFTGIRLNITNTASAAGSVLIDLQQGGKTLFSVDGTSVSGGVRINVGSSTLTGNADFILRTSGFLYDIAMNTSGVLGFYDGTSTRVALSQGSAGNFRVASDYSIGFSNSSVDAVQAADVTLFRDAANALAQRNSTNSQILRVYNTYTDNFNYERGNIGWNVATNKFVIGSDAAGTGTLRDVGLYQGATEKLRISTNVLAFSTLDMNTNTIQNILNLIWNADTSLYRVAAKVLGHSAGGSANDGWFQWHGAQRVTADQSFTSNTTLASIITWNVEAGRTYSFFACILMTTGASAGGIQIAIGGTCTITNFIVDGICHDGGTVIPCTRRSAFGATNQIVANTNAGTTPVAYIFGTITVNAAGTLLVRFAQNVSNATASVVKQGSYGICYDMA